jgi:hypothetical protein
MGIRLQLCHQQCAPGQAAAQDQVSPVHARLLQLPDVPLTMHLQFIVLPRRLMTRGSPGVGADEAGTP